MVCIHFCIKFLLKVHAPQFSLFFFKTRFQSTPGISVKTSNTHVFWVAHLASRFRASVTVAFTAVVLRMCLILFWFV